MFPSWEQRSHLRFEEYITNNSIGRVVFLLKSNSLNIRETATTLNILKDICNRRGVHIKEVELLDDNFSCFEKLRSIMSEILNMDEVCVDITTMPRNVIWSLLFYIKQVKKSIHIIYFSPQEYTKDWISREPSKPRLLFKHSGIVNLDLKNCLVIVTGFDTDRTQQLVRYFEPHKVILMSQSGERFNNNIRNDANKHKHICENLGYNNVDIIEFDAYSCDMGLSVVKKIIDNNKDDFNFILSSLGPKLSAISLYQAHMLYPETALAYVPCKEYNVSYCNGIGELYEGDIEF